MIMEVKIENSKLDIEVGDILQFEAKAIGNEHYYVVCQSPEGFYLNNLSGKRKTSLSFYDTLESLIDSLKPKKIFKSREYYMLLAKRGEKE
jgi:hypothetical protein